MKNYYLILNIKILASIKEIKQAYRSLALKFHPDRGGDSEKMKEINEAYEYLIRNKLEYDKQFNFITPRFKEEGFTIVVNGFGFRYETNNAGGAWTSS